MKDRFNFLGFTINTRKFVLGLIITFATILLLIGIDMLWFKINWYGLLIGLAFVVAVMIANVLGKERGLYKDFSYDLIWLVFPFAIIGARLGYVLNDLQNFPTLGSMLQVWDGGLSIFGGIIGGVVAVFIFAYLKKINPLKIMDVAAPVLILGQAIGRWGNFANQEVYGFEVTNSALQWFPFSVFIESSQTWHLATFFYESIINLIGFFLLVKLLRKTEKPGTVTFSYLIWYGVVRLILESLRVEQFVLYIPGTSLMFSSVASMVFIAVGIAGLVLIKLIDRKNSQTLSN